MSEDHLVRVPWLLREREREGERGREGDRRREGEKERERNTERNEREKDGGG